MGSAEVKIMNLTAQRKSCEGRSDKAYWGGSIAVPCGELDAINHNLQADNTDVIIISIRDPLTGDVYVYRHVVNPYHDYKIGGGTTFRILTHQPTVIDGHPPAPRHRPTIAMKAWMDHLEMWTGAPPIMILHFHPTAQDAQWDCERPQAPAGVPIIRGVGCGTVAPADAALTHDFLRARMAWLALERINENPEADFDGECMNTRVKVFDSLFAGGNNSDFGELGCVIAQDALRVHGAAATARHPKGNWHYDLLFSYPGGDNDGGENDGVNDDGDDDDDDDDDEHDDDDDDEEDDD
jgi:hypothetical protein